MNNNDNIPQPIVAISVKSPADIANVAPSASYNIELDNIPIAQPIKNENALMFFEPDSSKKIAIAIRKPPKAGLAQPSICCQKSPVISIRTIYNDWPGLVVDFGGRSFSYLQIYLGNQARSAIPKDWNLNKSSKANVLNYWYGD